MDDSRDGASPIRAVSAVRQESTSREGSPLRRQGAIKRHDSPRVTRNVRRKRARLGRQQNTDLGSDSDSPDSGEANALGAGSERQRSDSPPEKDRAAAEATRPRRLSSEKRVRRVSSLTTFDALRAGESSDTRSPSSEPADAFLRNFQTDRRQSAAGVSPETAERASQLSSTYGNAWDLRRVGKESQDTAEDGAAPPESSDGQDSTCDNVFFFPGDEIGAEEVGDRPRVEEPAPESPAVEERRAGIRSQSDDGGKKNGFGFLSVLRAYRRSVSREASPLEAIADRVMHRRRRSTSGDLRGPEAAPQKRRDARSLLAVVRDIAKSRTPPPLAPPPVRLRRRSPSPSPSPFLAALVPPRRSRSTCEAPRAVTTPQRSSSARPVPAPAPGQLAAAVRRRRRRIASSSESSSSSSSETPSSSSRAAAASSSSDGGRAWRRRRSTARSYSDAGAGRPYARRRRATGGVAAMLARHALALSLPAAGSGAAAVPPPPPPLLVQAPPSSDEDDELRVLVHSDGSSGCSGQQVAKSAPCTPHGDRVSVSVSGSVSAGVSERDKERLAPAYDRDLPSPRTPTHSFTRHDRQLKQLSVSAPAMTHHQQQQAMAAAAAAAARGASDQPSVASGSPEPAHSSKYRQKKFHRHFKQVAAEEYVLNYYSCALVGDILLQGHLYITKNYFAFYSNVFGYVTKLLIPTISVTKISKEKTAYIIPNAVGVSTAEGKHVFGSLLSRDSTHRLMMQVWKAAQQPDPQGNLLPIEQVMKDEVDSASGDVKDDDDSSVSGSDRSCAPSSLECNTNIKQPEAGCTKLPNGSLVIGGKHIKLPVKSSPKHAIVGLPRSKWLLIVSTGLLVLLFFSAAFLLYRISKIQSQFTEHPLITTSDEVYQEILKWQSQLHSKSVNEVQEFLSTNLDQLAKVRQSLEALSLLIVSEGEQLQQSQQQSQEPIHSEPTGKQQTPTLPHDKHS